MSILWLDALREYANIMHCHATGRATGNLSAHTQMEAVSTHPIEADCSHAHNVLGTAVCSGLQQKQVLTA